MPLVEKYVKVLQKKTNTGLLVEKEKKINRKNCTWYRKLIAPFSWCKGKKQEWKREYKTGRKNFIFIGVTKQRKQLKVLITVYGRKL